MNRDRLDFGNERIGSLFRALFFPTLIGMVFNSLLNICDGMFVGHGVAAYSVGCYLFPIIFSINNAVAQAAQPIISFNHGAGRPDRVRSTLHISICTAIICGLLITAGMWAGAPMLSSLFIPAGDAAHDIAAAGLPLLGTCTVFFALNITFIGYYQSMEKAARSTAYTMLRGIVFLVPSFLVLPPLLGEKGLWLAIPAAEVLTLAVIAVLFLYRRVRV